VYKSAAEIYAQVINDETGTTVASASTIDNELKKALKGLKKSEQARKVGTLLAERAKQKGIKEVVFDRGGFRFMGRVKALADGAREGGLVF
jgi:large subunit ribosomal protein L18